MPTFEEIAGAVARGWCAPENARKVMDSELAYAITREIEALLDESHQAHQLQSSVERISGGRGLNYDQPFGK